MIQDKHLLLNKHVQVPIGKKAGKPPYLQPSLFLYKDGVEAFSWIQTPKMLNFGGAINRFSVPNLVKEVAKLR